MNKNKKPLIFLFESYNTTFKVYFRFLSSFSSHSCRRPKASSPNSENCPKLSEVTDLFCSEDVSWVGRHWIHVSKGQDRRDFLDKMAQIAIYIYRVLILKSHKIWVGFEFEKSINVQKVCNDQYISIYFSSIKHDFTYVILCELMIHFFL